MRLSIAAVVLGIAACATAPAPKGTPTSFQPVCMPCPMPCTPETSCKQAVAAAPKPAPAPAPAPAPKPAAAAAPTFSPEPGTFERSQQVTLSSSTPNAVIHYTLDGSEPTESSPVYSGPITVDQTTTIKAIAIAPGAPPSSVASGAFTAAPPPPPKETPRVAVTKEKLELQDKVYFDTGKATIKPVSYGLLDEVATALKGHDEVKKVRIEGHTDSMGNPKSNLKLSQARAEAVRTYLVDKGGVAGDRLEAKGFGDTQPVGPNKTAKQREANRRVEFRVVQ